MRVWKAVPSQYEVLGADQMAGEEGDILDVWGVQR